MIQKGKAMNKTSSTEIRIEDGGSWWWWIAVVLLAAYGAGATVGMARLRKELVVWQEDATKFSAQLETCQSDVAKLRGTK